MRYAAAFAIIMTFAAFLFVGCIGNFTTGASYFPDVNWYSGRLNATGVNYSIELHNTISKHVFVVWTSYAESLSNSTSFTSTTARSCDNSTQLYAFYNIQTNTNVTEVNGNGTQNHTFTQAPVAASANITVNAALPALNSVESQYNATALNGNGTRIVYLTRTPDASKANITVTAELPAANKSTSTYNDTAIEGANTTRNLQVGRTPIGASLVVNLSKNEYSTVEVKFNGVSIGNITNNDTNAAYTLAAMPIVGTNNATFSSNDSALTNVTNITLNYNYTDTFIFSMNGVSLGNLNASSTTYTNRSPVYWQNNFTLVTTDSLANITNISVSSRYTEVITISLNGVALGNLTTSSTTYTGKNAIRGLNNLTITTTNGDANLTNSTISTLYQSQNCTNSSALGGGNFSTYKAATSYYVIVTTTNENLSNASTFEVNIYGANKNQANASDSAEIYLYKVGGGGVYMPTGQFLPINTTNWTNITGLDVATYVDTGGVVGLKFVANSTGANAAFEGISIDYVAYKSNRTYSLPSEARANVTFQTSLDNRNWFTELTLTNISTAERYQINSSALYARFNVTDIDMTDPAQDGVYVQYNGVGG